MISDPFPATQTATARRGRLLYHNKTSAVFSPGGVGEQHQKEFDAFKGTYTVGMRRQLNERGVEYFCTRDLRSGEERSSRRHFHITPDEEDAFDSEWIAQAEQYLPHYKASHSRLEENPNRARIRGDGEASNYYGSDRSTNRPLKLGW